MVTRTPFPPIALAPFAAWTFACSGASRGGEPPVSPPASTDVAAPAADPAGRPVDEPFRAVGVEPFWSLRVDRAQARLERPGEAPVVYDAPTQVDEEGGMRFTAGDGALRVTAAREVCRDAATGMPHPFRVTVAHRGETLVGCGGEPVALLAGSWTVEQIAGVPIAEGTRATLVFDAAERRVAGTTSCNQYGAGFTLGGEGLRVEQAISTRMACPPPRMQQERAFLDALGAVERFDVDGPDRLVLHAADGRTIVARRATDDTAAPR